MSNRHPVQQDVHSEKRKPFGRKRSKKVGSITFCLASIISKTQTESELKAAEDSIERIEALVNRTENADGVIGCVIVVAENIITIVDEIAEVRYLLHRRYDFLCLPVVRSILYSTLHGKRSRHCTRCVRALSSRI